MAKKTALSVVSGFASQAQLNAEFADIADHLNNKVHYRDNPAGETNSFQNDIDVNSNQINNLGDATNVNDAPNWGQVQNKIAAAGSGLISSDLETQTATASQTVFTLVGISYTPGVNNLSVYINGLKQFIGTAYTETSSTVVTFTEGLQVGDVVQFVTNESTTSSVSDASGVTYDPAGTGSVDTNVQDKLREFVSVKDFGAVGDGVTDDTSAISAWFDYLIANDLTGYLVDGTYLVDYITKAAASGLKLTGTGTIKATGSTRKNMIRFTGVTGKIEIDSVTFDGNDLVARVLEIQNTSSATLGDVYIGPTVKILNAKNTTPDTNISIGLYVFGNFDTVTFAGEIDSSEDTRTSGAGAYGIIVTWSTTYWVRNTVITSTARIKNIRNSNAATADADGVQCFAPTTEYATLTVAPGALFEECEGRSIKSQVVQNSINGPVIRRSLYDGLTEIDLQYSGGYVSGAQVFYDGTRVNNVIGTTTRLNLPSHCTISGNTLTITGTPSSNTGAMVQSWGTDVTDAIESRGITIRDNKVKGTVDFMAQLYAANVIDTNKVLLDGNWVETIGTSYIDFRVVYNNNAQMTLVFTNNSSSASCTGATITASSGALIMQAEFGNHNITQILADPHKVTIATGAITVYGTSHRVDTEAAASTDDLDTITAPNRSDSDWLTLKAHDGARTVVLKDGTGNLRLAGDFSLTSTQDRIVLSYDGTNWCELFRSDNGV